MFQLISAPAKAQSFTFTGTGSLYRDHHGNRVLADVEGRGTFQIESRLAPSVIVDDQVHDLFHGSYERSLLVATADPGPCRVEVFEGRPDPLQGPIETGREFKGCGYVLEARKISCLDGEHACLDDVALPAPFLFGASGEGLRVVRSDQRMEAVAALEPSDEQSLRTVGWKVQNVSKLFPLDSRFPDGTPFSGFVLSHLNAAKFTVSLPSDNQGIVLRKRYDAFHGRQRARVLIDGDAVGWWYEPWQDRESRWRWARFGVPGAFVTGKEAVTITIDPPAGSPLWSVGRMEVWALRSNP